MPVTRSMMLAAIFGLTACTQYWAKPGGTEGEFEATKSACHAQSYAQFPPVYQQVQITSGYVTPIQTSCSGYGYGANCFTTGGQYIPPAFTTVDLNETGRNNGFRSCLFTAGWRPVKSKEEAEAVTNSIR